MDRITRLSFVSIFLIVVVYASASAQSVLNFPRVISSSDVFTGIAVSNPATSDATVTFTAFLADGTLLSSATRNPITVTIPAGGQYTRQFSEIFGFPGSFNGWVQATSGSGGLAGFFLNSNGAVTDLDGAAVTDPAADLVIPFASEAGGSKTEITVLNPNTESTNVTLTAYSATGQQVASHDATIASRSLIRQTLANIFTTFDVTGISFVRIQADRVIAAHEVVANYAMSGSAISRESAALSGLRVTNDQTYVLPQFVTGGGWMSSVNIINVAGIDQDMTLTAYGENGSKLNFPLNPKRLTLAGNATLNSTVADLFGIQSTDLTTGWIQIQSTVGPLISFVGTGNTVTPSFATVAGISLSSAAPFQVYSQVSEGGGFFSGLTLVNPSTNAASVDFYALTAEGTTVGKSTFNIPANGRSGHLFSEILPATFDQTSGWVLIRSSQPVIGAELFGATSGASLATVPAQATGSFQPPALSSFSISGTVSESGVPVSGAAVMLTGPVVATQTTDLSGRFNFFQLPAGNYTVAPLRTGLQFAPANRSVTIAADNVASVSFEAAGGAPSLTPVISQMSPSAVLAGTSVLNLRVFGANFSAASVVILNNNALQTTFVSSSELQAVVPSSTLQTATTLSVAVSTPPPGGGTSSVLNLSVLTPPSNPLIQGRVAVGSFPAGVAVDSTRQIALVSNESSDSVSVIDLKTLTVSAEIKVGRSPAEGVAINESSDIALVANTGSDNVSVINLKTNAVTANIAVDQGPLDVAINPSTNRAVVVNRAAETISIIDLGTLQVTGSVAVPGDPTAVAINPTTNIAVVARRATNDVVLVDLGTNSIVGTIAVGRTPRAVAINALRNLAVVANANSASISILDLATRSVIGTIAVGPGPTGVAIHALTNNAIVSNSGFCLSGCANSDGSPSTVSIVNLDQQIVMRTVPVGASAYGVDVDNINQRAVVANYGSSDTTVIQIPNPTPHVTSVDPKTFPTGGGAVTLTIGGNGFVPTSVATLNGNPLSTTFISTIQLQAVLSAETVAALLSGRSSSSVLAASRVARLDGFSRRAVTSSADTVASFNIGVSSPGPGGGDSPPSSTATLQPMSQAPVLWGVDPKQTTVDVPFVDITLTGNNFSGLTTVNFGGSVYTPTSSSPTSVTIRVLHDSLVVGPVNITVTNPSPGGGTSGSVAFKVDPAGNPLPKVQSVTPATATAGSPDSSFTIAGSGFVANVTTVSVGGQTVSASVSTNSISITVPASLLKASGGLPVLVINPAPGGGSAGTNISVLNPVPTVSSVTPASANANTGATAIAVVGTGFVPDSQVYMADTSIATNYVDSTRLLATIPAKILRRAGTLQMFVINKAPGGGKAPGGPFNIIAPQPVLTAIKPNTITAGRLPVDIVLTGTGFIINSTVLADGSPIPAVDDAPEQITATIPATLLTKGGTINITVQNPAPGGTSAPALPLTVNNPVPVLTSITPNSIRSDLAPSTVIAIRGQNFVSTSSVTLGPINMVVAYVSDTLLNAGFPSLVPFGDSPVTIVNPTPGGGSSNTMVFSIQAITPTITSITPGTAGSNQIVKVVGTNFGIGTTAFVGGVAAAVNVTSSTQLNLTIPPGLPLGPSTVVLRNPTNLDSQPFPIQIANPAPTITSLNPSLLRAGEGPTTVTVNGTAFIATSVVQIDGKATNTVFVNPTTLKFVIDPSTGGAPAITVSTPAPGGGLSNAVSLTVLDPVPRLSSVSPTSADANTTVQITVTGSYFEQGASILVNGSAIGTTFVSDTTLQGTLQLGGPGFVIITVVNPGNVPSAGQLSFVINSPPPPPKGSGISLQITILDVYSQAPLPNTTVVVNGSTLVTDGSGSVLISVVPGVISFQINAGSGYIPRSFTRPIPASFSYPPFDTSSPVPYAMRVYPSTHNSVAEVDTDGDGLPDRVETRTGTFNSVDDIGTDPTNKDTDGDGLDDGTEILDGPEVPGMVLDIL